MRARLCSEPMSAILQELTRRVRESEPYRTLRDRLGAAERLPLAAAAWVAELLAQDLGRPLLVVVSHEADALAWIEASRLFGGTPVYFPAPSLSPYKEADVSLHVRAAESVALYRILKQQANTLVCSPRALFRKLPAAEAIFSGVVEIRAGGEVPLEQLVLRLSDFGYRRVDLVTEVGDFAIRGGVFDVCSPGEGGPVRLDFFGDTVEAVRRFDPHDQRSQEELEETVVLPLSLYPSGRAAASDLAELLSSQLGLQGEIGLAENLEALRRQGRFPGWEHYLPLLESSEICLPDLVEGCLGVTVSPERLTCEIEQHAHQLVADYKARVEQRRVAVPPELLEHTLERVEKMLTGCEVTILDSLGGDSSEAVDFGGSTTDIFHGQLPRFPREVETARARGERLIMVCAVEHRRRLEGWSEFQEVPLGAGGVELVEGELTRGFRLPLAGAVLYGERQLFPRVAPARPRPKSPFGPFMSGLRDLKVGDFVVHRDHGIGQLVALRTVGGEAGDRADLPPSLVSIADRQQPAEVEVMDISYSDGRSLLLPLSGLDLIQRYTGIEGIAPRLDRLGGTSWSRTKARVKRRLRKLAVDLLRLYAERRLARAPALSPDTDFQSQFESAFDFEETEDQLESIAAIKLDLEREQPMDRLLCGDVGFGKTEVAMRAAFKTVDGGYQVAVLAPTTILADQHLETFRARFAGFPICIEMISRGRSARDVSEIRRGLASGVIDILIGTHRLLSRDVEIPRLGLLIVDEEQRFGVAQKERVVELKKHVHVLSMSATPVPRTLQLALAGVRDLSIIETPPRDRMAVETAILPFSAELVREAIEFELERSGQVYYVHNRVESIEDIASSLRELVPGLRLVVGHGQLPEAELARRMHAFKRGDHDLLLATTIIENGIDISNVNTMIVHRADRFGLAQLYQLRGRVGRSNQLAYCYLLVPTDRALSEQARKRLLALREFTELGAGFRVAARDLEIRGAGNLLGAEQSGHISALGIETYLKVLEEAVRELKGETVEEAPAAALDLPVSTAIPQDYLGDANLRMDVYRRIAAGKKPANEILAELRDRFGPPPEAVHQLIAVAALKRQAEELRVQSISSRGSRLHMRLRRDTRIDIDRLIRLVSEREGARFSPSGVLVLEAEGRPMVELAREVLEELTT